MAYTTPAPHQCPIIHLCFGIFVSKEIPRQQIGNQSFGQSLPLEVNVCPLHAAEPSCNHSIFFAVADQKWHFGISKYSPPTTMEIQREYFNLLFLSGFQRAGHFVPVKITEAQARSKLGTLQRSGGVAMMRESSLPLWAPMLPSSDAKQSYIYNLGMLNQPISMVTSTHTCPCAVPPTPVYSDYIL